MHNILTSKKKYIYIYIPQIPIQHNTCFDVGKFNIVWFINMHQYMHWLYIYSSLVVVEEIPPFYVKHFEYPEKHYRNVYNYNYY